MEKRYFGMEFRVEAMEEGAPRRIVGLAPPYHVRSADLGGFVEEILPGAFTRTLRERDQVALWSHDTGKPLGRKSRGTLVIREEAAGLVLEITPPDTTWGRDALISVERGDVAEVSFGFLVPKGGDSWRREDKLIVRSLVDVDLLELSPVVFPAYPATQLGVRELYGDVPALPVEFMTISSDSRGATDEDVVGWREAQARRRRLLRLQVAG